MPASVTVAIIGTGFAGLAAAIQLLEAGVRDLLLLEQADSVGGTWRDNTYPGAACDVPAHLYSLSFAPKADWSTRFARQPEIRAYMEELVERFALRPFIRFGVRVEAARFDADDAQWVLRTSARRAPPGAETPAAGETLRARFLISAVGPLRVPRMPKIPGLERFEGPGMHSARWDASAQLGGRRVGVVGTGASAVQVVPELAKLASELHVFQRTPAWIVERHDRRYGALSRAALKRVPGLRWLLRLKQYLEFEVRYPLVFGARAPLGPLVQREIKRFAGRYIQDPELLAALIPDYRVGCKRVLSSSEFYPALAKENVSLHPQGVAEVLPRGVRLRDGQEIPLDVLVYCTGFAVDKPLGDLEVTGLDGQDLADFWGSRPRAWLGVTVPRFPNLFILLGPNSGLGHNSVLLMAEAQVRYIVAALRHVSAEGAAWLDLRPGRLEAFTAELDAAHAGQAWLSGCHSWYLNEEGQNFTIWPGSTLSYMWRTRRFDPESYRWGG